MSLFVRDIGPAVALQDLGRPGHIAQGLTQGGAVDRRALYEGAALLAEPAGGAALEMVGIGGVFEARADLVIALTGARMRADIDGAALLWNTSYRLGQGQTLTLGPVLEGTYAYLSVAGGFQTPLTLGARGAHLSVGLGQLVGKGDMLPTHSSGVLPDERVLGAEARFSGGVLRVMPSMQTLLFSQNMQNRLAAETFTPDMRSDRQGLKLNHAGAPFAAENTLSILSEIAVCGDVQISGTGAPFILLSEGQTTAGYPRIGTVLPCDVPRAVQCPPGAELRFAWVTLEEARQIEARARREIRDLPGKARPRIRSAMDIANLRDYNLISGATAGE